MPGVLDRYRALEPRFAYAKLAKAVAAEFLGTFLFILSASGAVTSGCHVADVVKASGNEHDTQLIHAAPGSCTLQSNLVLNIALAFSITLFVVIFFTAPFSGGHINPAITVGALLAGKVSLLKAVLYIIFQCLGSLLAAAVLKGLDPYGYKAAGGVVNALNSATGISPAAAWGAETILTFALVLTVFAATDLARAPAAPHLQALAPFGIAMVVFFAHLVLLPIDGCSVNPARSFGPAVVANAWERHWIFWVGPIMGAVIAALVYELGFNLPEPKEDSFLLVKDFEERLRRNLRSMSPCRKHQRLETGAGGCGTLTHPAQ